MITTWQMYWLTRMDSLGFLFGVPAIIGLIAGTICIIMMAMIRGSNYRSEGDEKTAANCQKIGFKVFSIAIPLFIISCFIPTTKEMAAILIVPRVLNNEKVQELPNNVLDLANEWMKELVKEKKEEK